MNILVVVDMQNDFIDGALGTPEAVAIVPKVMVKMMNFDGLVLATRDTHGEDYLEKQDDIKLIKKKDYISHPKPNGYRSLHLILEVPIFLTNEKKMMRVEVQFRTIAMDFWASLEHKLKYKKDIDNAQVISQDLCFCAELISQLDGRMQQIRERLEEKKDDTQSNITGV